MSFNTYEVKNAIDKIHGYYLPTPREECLDLRNISFERAKQELIVNLKRHIECIESVSYEKFKKGK
jgi:hypothetical protein